MKAYKIAKRTVFGLVVLYVVSAFLQWDLPIWSWEEFRSWLAVALLVSIWQIYNS